MEVDPERVPIEDDVVERLQTELETNKTLLGRQRSAAKLLVRQTEELKKSLCHEQEKAANYQAAYEDTLDQLRRLNKKYGENKPTFTIPESAKQLINSLTEDNLKLGNYIKSTAASGRQDGPDLVRELQSLKRDHRLLQAKAGVYEKVCGYSFAFMKQQGVELGNEALQRLPEQDCMIAKQEQKIQELLVALRSMVEQKEELLRKVAAMDGARNSDDAMKKKMLLLEEKNKELTHNNQYLLEQGSAKETGDKCDGTCQYVKDLSGEFNIKRDSVVAVVLSLQEKFGKDHCVIEETMELFRKCQLIDEEDSIKKQPASKAVSNPLPSEPHVFHAPRTTIRQLLLSHDGPDEDEADTMDNQETQPTATANDKSKPLDYCETCLNYFPEGGHVCKHT